VTVFFPPPVTPELLLVMTPALVMLQA